VKEHGRSFGHLAVLGMTGVLMNVLNGQVLAGGQIEHPGQGPATEEMAEIVFDIVGGLIGTEA
jgi:hypothetical protein